MKAMSLASASLLLVVFCAPALALLVPPLPIVSPHPMGSAGARAAAAARAFSQSHRSAAARMVG